MRISSRNLYIYCVKQGNKSTGRWEMVGGTEWKVKYTGDWLGWN